MSVEHHEETMFDLLLKSGAGPEFAAGVARDYKELVQAKHGIPEKTMRDCISMIRRAMREKEDR